MRAIDAALEYGFLATLIYRFGRWTRKIRPRALSLPFKIIYAVLRVISNLVFGIDISTNAAIGPGLHIGHFGGIFLHGDMGSGCSIAQNVTIGYKGAGRSSRAPRLGDNVYVGCGAVILGDVTVGTGVVVGANTTVVADVPAGATAVGARSRIILPASNRTAPESDA